MADENTESDIEFVKGYLQSCIELEAQKRIAKKTFNELTQEENKWKEKISYKAKETVYQLFCYRYACYGSKRSGDIYGNTFSNVYVFRSFTRR